MNPNGNQGVSPAQYQGTPSNYTVATGDGTVFTTIAGQRGFLQNLGTGALAVKLGASASTSSFSFILPACSSQDDGTSLPLEIADYVGVVSVAAMSGTARYIAWTQS